MIVAFESLPDGQLLMHDGITSVAATITTYNALCPAFCACEVSGSKPARASAC